MVRNASLESLRWGSLMFSQTLQIEKGLVPTIKILELPLAKLIGQRNRWGVK